MGEATVVLVVLASGAGRPSPWASDRGAGRPRPWASDRGAGRPRPWARRTSENVPVLGS
ncbi:hypothetical protein F2Q68_00025785 [Brassica cretica]|uniref:Uncharacterized protein n=1 Tax=Brassica cretica TaxID=69181 RepID=A0A8S9IF18_BRACR|nr:hypothetical protein F2Q68_00025785 [Brassica cretica]